MDRTHSHAHARTAAPVALAAALAVAALAAWNLALPAPTRADDAAAKPGIAANAMVLVKLDEAWSKDAATKDPHQVASYYADDAIAYPPGAPAATGRDAAEKVWGEYLGMPGFSISWTTTHAELAKSGDMGFTAGTYEDSYPGPDGKTVSEKGKYLCVWHKQKDGSWKAIHDMWNADAK